MNHYIKVLFSSLALSLLTACASWISPNPPDAPTPREVRVYFEQVYNLQYGQNAAGKTNGSTDSSTVAIDGVQVAKSGYQLVDIECKKFFSAAERMTNDAEFNRKEATLAGTAAAGVLAAVKASAKSIAIAGLGIGLLGGSIENFENFALLTSDPGNVYGLVQKAMAAYVVAAPQNNASIMADPSTAMDYVAGYAALCSYPQIQLFVTQAIAKANIVNTSQSAPSIFTSDDQTQLLKVNTDLGLPATLLSDASYVKLFWYLSGGYTNPDNRTLVLQDFGTIAQSLWAANSLPTAAIAALKDFDVIATRNPALTSGAQALAAANKPTNAPAPRVQLVEPVLANQAAQIPHIEVK